MNNDTFLKGDAIVKVPGYSFETNSGRGRSHAYVTTVYLDDVDIYTIDHDTPSYGPRHAKRFIKQHRRGKAFGQRVVVK